ncbi:MAG TPA: hypothetical protein VKY59_03930 [Spirillospora sp.]|nr:hypothetical protein [Spirillospora sp.]
MRQSSLPAWMVFVVAVAVIFGTYYLWQGFRSYLETGGLGIMEATERAQIIATATAEQVREIAPRTTLHPTFTPIPECKQFVVSVPSAIVREGPSTNAAIITSWSRGTQVCMIDRAPTNDEWYIVDGNPETRRVEFAYMHESVIEAVNPTLTPSRTPTPLSTVTPLPTDTPSRTPTPAPTATIDPRATATPTLTPSATATPSPTPTISFRSV